MGIRIPHPMEGCDNQIPSAPGLQTWCLKFVHPSLTFMFSRACLWRMRERSIACLPYTSYTNRTIKFWPSATWSLVLQHLRWRINVKLLTVLTVKYYCHLERCTEAREIKITAGNLEPTYPTRLRQDIPRTEKAGQGILSSFPRPKRPNYRIWELVSYVSTKHGPRNWPELFAVLVQKWAKYFRGWFASTFPCLMRALISWTRRFLVWQDLGFDEFEDCGGFRKQPGKGKERQSLMWTLGRRKQWSTMLKRRLSLNRGCKVES